MSFKNFSNFSSGGHFCSAEWNHFSIFIKSHKRNTSVKLFFKSGTGLGDVV